MSEAYGMTETSCLISGTQDGDTTSGHVGSISQSCGMFLCLIIKIERSISSLIVLQYSSHMGSSGVNQCKNDTLQLLTGK